MKRTTFWGRIAAGLCIVAATFAAPAHAEDNGFYGNVDIGLAVLPDLGGEGDLNDIPISSTSVDQSTRPWAARLGFRFSKYFSMDAGYLDLGKSKATYADAARTVDATATYGVRGPTLAFIPSYPFGRWEPFVKFGLLWQHVDAKLTGTLPAPVGAFTLHVSEDGMKYFWGTGVRYNFSPHWQGKFELNWYPHLGDDEPTGIANVPAIAFGAQYRF